jgi:hypothetical protein
MAAQPRIAFTPVKPLTGLSLAREAFAEAASQTYKAGAPVVLASGLLQECGTDPILIMGIAAGEGKNVAAAAAKQTVYLAHPDTLFKGNLDDGSGTRATVQSDLGKFFGIAKDSGSGKWYVDSTELSNKRVIIWGFWDGVQDGVQAAIGDTLGHVYFQFGHAYFQGGHTS